ncbi:GNAT family N-acetyltransferase, partial [Gammaproteobacteria bacterium]|nr:GNAT family N-acetyltransferase [Gammaproteobacteria bacterium]
TENLDKMESQISKGRMRDIRLSLREGAEIIEKPSWNQVAHFYEILSHLYQKKIRLPLFGLEFFRQLYALDEALFLLVEYQGQIIGGVVCVGLDNKAMYEWYACGINGIYDKVTATALATYAGMKYAALNHYPIFDMMGAGVPDKEYGVRTFKEKFGGKLVEEGRFLCVTKPKRFIIGKLGVAFIRRFGFFH